MPVIQNETGLTLDTIVVATDFTPESEKALAYARALAHQFASRITLAHVIDLSVATQNPEAVIGFPLDEMRHDSAENLQRTLSCLETDGINAKGQVIESTSPASAIVEFSETVDADLVIVGTHNRHGLSKLILGSCSGGVIRNAKCPVFTIGPKATPHPVDVAFRSILFATDLQHNAVEKAAVALAFAKDSIANVHLCHIVEEPAESITDAFHHHARAEFAISRLIPDASYNWCSPKPSVLFGNVDQEILKAARDASADLIVLGAHRSSPWLSHFWSGVVEDVLAEATCPVLTICTG